MWLSTKLTIRVLTFKYNIFWFEHFKLEKNSVTTYAWNRTKYTILKLGRRVQLKNESGEFFKCNIIKHVVDRCSSF